MDNGLLKLKENLQKGFPQGHFTFKENDSNMGKIFYDDNDGFFKQVGSYYLGDDLYLTITCNNLKKYVIENTQSTYFKSMMEAVKLNESLFSNSSGKLTNVSSLLDYYFINDNFIITGQIIVTLNDIIMRKFSFTKYLNEEKELLAINNYYKNNYYASCIDKYVYDMTEDEKNLVKIFLYQ